MAFNSWLSRTRKQKGCQPAAPSITLERGPLAIALAALDNLLHKPHAAGTVVNGREVELEFSRLAAFEPGPDRIDVVHVNVGKGSKEGFGKTGSQMGRA